MPTFCFAVSDPWASAAPSETPCFQQQRSLVLLRGARAQSAESLPASAKVAGSMPASLPSSCWGTATQPRASPGGRAGKGRDGRAGRRAGPGAGPLSAMAGDEPGFLQALQPKGRPEAVQTRVQAQDLGQWGLTGERRCKVGLSSWTPTIVCPPRPRRPLGVRAKDRADARWGQVRLSLCLNSANSLRSFARPFRQPRTRGFSAALRGPCSACCFHICWLVAGGAADRTHLAFQARRAGRQVLESPPRPDLLLLSCRKGARTCRTHRLSVTYWMQPSTVRLLLQT
jgi:hypothetical protein